MTVAESAFALSARRYLPSLRVRAVLSATYFFLSNIGLFHVIFKTVNDFILCKTNQVT